MDRESLAEKSLSQAFSASNVGVAIITTLISSKNSSDIFLF